MSQISQTIFRVIGVLLLGVISLSLLAQQTPDPILSAMRRADPAIQSVAILTRVAGSGDIKLSMVVGTARPELVPNAGGTFPWNPSDTLSLLSEDKNSSPNIRI